ncbi:MAG: thioredoxin domain-containing protein [Bacteroidetes bacterium]|nr:thioredoxin domain-containing protein [Bacteroidota bacterium]
MKRKIVLLLVFGVFVSNAQKINWYAWGETPFKKAIAEHKPVFLDVGTEWCTACNLMEEKTYTDTSIIRIINQNFIAIKADAEAQPDVGARFLEWGWPALIFLDSAGNQLKALQGNRRSEIFKPILLEFLANYKAGKLTVQNNDFFSSEPPDKSGLPELYKKSYSQLDYYYDSLYYGWGYALKIPLYQPVELCFWLNKTDKKSKDLGKALSSLNQYSKISDRMAGGVYFGCSSGRTWKGAQPEKRTEYQAGVMHNYAEAFMTTGDKKWLNEANLLRTYLMSSMFSKEDSLFYNSQEEYIDLADEKVVISPEKYFKLPADQRAKYGFPPIDKTLYTDINFRIVRAFLKLYEATQNKADLDLAVLTANRIIKKGYLKEGWFKTVIDNKNEVKRMRDLPGDSAQRNVMYLKTQAHAALAMLSLYQFTGDTSWLVRCENLKNRVNEKLYDNENGGYFSTNLMPVTLSGKRAATKVLIENALFARFLIEYSDLSGNEELIKMAESSLRSVGVDKILSNEERLIADFVLATSKLMKHHLVFTVVSNDFNSDDTKNLIKQVQHYYHPAKLVKIEKPGHYPDLGKASLFICNQTVCSQPISYSANSKAEIDLFIKKLK